MWEITGTIPVGHPENATEKDVGRLSGIWDSLAKFSPKEAFDRMLGNDPLRTPKQMIHSVAWGHDDPEESPVMVEEPARWFNRF